MCVLAVQWQVGLEACCGVAESLQVFILQFLVFLADLRINLLKMLFMSFIVPGTLAFKSLIYKNLEPSLRHYFCCIFYLKELFTMITLLPR